MDDKQNKNTMLAIALSVLVLIGWQFFYVSPKLEQERKTAELEAQRQEQITQQRDTTNQNANGDLPLVKPGSGDGSIPAATQNISSGVPGSLAVPRDVAIANSKRVEFENEHIIGSISLMAGRIDDLRLKGYHETIDKSSPLITLLSPSEAEGAYFAEFGYVGTPSSGDVPGPKAEWVQVSSGTLTPTSPLVLEWSNSKKLTFRRTIRLDEIFLFTIEDEVINNSSDAVAVSSYGRLTRFGTPQTENIFVLHEGLIGYFGEDGLQEIDYSDLKDDQKYPYDKTDSGWLGITDKYWATALMPNSAFTPRFAYFADGRERYQSDFLGDPLSIAAGTTVKVSHNLFAGAKKEEVIDSYTLDEPGFLSGLFKSIGSFFSSGIPYNTSVDNQAANFDLMIDWGWFYFITKPLFKLMNWLFHLFGNFGVAILATTVVIKALLFPLANLSYASMAKMKKVQPEMERIKEAVGDDRLKLQQEMMALYKKEKINPAAGCWPMLIQIPVFFALYKVIYVTIEMRHAPFFGWIRDLSAPDPTSIFNLFGILPFESPAFLAVVAIGIWPLFMGITMFLQMQMNPAPPDPTQAMIFKWMPVVFTFVLAAFPAGLVIYWAWNNLLSIFQQGFIMTKHGVKIELWDNLKGLFGRRKADASDQ